MKRSPPKPSDITGVILAGGRGRRLGGIDKGLAEFAGRPLVEWVLDALAPQIGTLLINANRHRETYARYGVPVIADLDSGFNGPLAGMLSAMRAARTEWILTVPCDGPLLPPDLANRLITALMSGDAALATVIERGRTHPVYSLMPVSLEQALSGDLAAGTRKVADWIAGHDPALADFSDRPQAFCNLNSAEDIARLASQLMQPK